MRLTLYGTDNGWRISRRWAVRAACLALPIWLGACTALPDWADPSDWFAGDVEPTVVAQDQAQASSDKFPNLASVPNAAPEVTQPGTRAALRETLAADRANAEYSGQKLVAESPPPPSKITPATNSVLPTSAGAAPAAAADAPRAAPAESAPEQPTVVAEAPKESPGESQYRFKQFDKPSNSQTAAVAPPLPARSSELVAVIYFGYGSVALNDNDRSVLQDVALLQRRSGGTVRVIGHASARTGIVDSVQHRLANLETSLNRANAVAAQLARLGVPKDKIAAEAKGDSQPVFHEFMPTGEAGNQRAEIFLEN